MTSAADPSAAARAGRPPTTSRPKRRTTRRRRETGQHHIGTIATKHETADQQRSQTTPASNQATNHKPHAESTPKPIRNERPKHHTDLQVTRDLRWFRPVRYPSRPCPTSSDEGQAGPGNGPAMPTANAPTEPGWRPSW